MNDLRDDIALIKYMRVPLYLIVLVVLMNVPMYLLNIYAGVAFSVLTIVYIIVMVLWYRKSYSRLEQKIMAITSDYNTVQKQMIERIEHPYALLDEQGRIVWVNSAMAKLVKTDVVYGKSINGFFKNLTREMIEKSTEDLHINVTFDVKIFSANLLHFTVSEESGMMGLLLIDTTELEETKARLDGEQLVAGLINIDNYEETVESIDDVQKSLLTALIDRRINRYFLDSNAIIRKVDRDKYFIAFQYKDLKAFEENKFSILEDVKKIKAGNENEITLSIGLGVHGENYNRNAEYARAAIDLALGRGGSQVVIKDGEEITSYGARGRELEKSTRVKARVKAQALREMMTARDRIIIMGHPMSDADALGAGIGVYCAARELGKETHIVLNNITTALRPLVDMFAAENGYPADLFIDSEKAVELATPQTMVIVVDTNRPSYTECPQLLKICDNVVVFDHHRVGNEVITGPMLSYIEPYASSACEMIAELLQYFSDKVRLEKSEADCIYAGMIVDTNNFLIKTGVRTFEAAAFLRRNGADSTRVRKLLREDMTAYKARAEVVRRAVVYRGAFAISAWERGDIESPTVVGAQAANELLNIVGIKASFVLTDYNNKIYVSARSLENINVQKIMESIGGGGHMNVAGAQIEGETKEQVADRIRRIIDEMIDGGEIQI